MSGVSHCKNLKEATICTHVAQGGQVPCVCVWQICGILYEGLLIDSRKAFVMNVCVPRIIALGSESF